MFWFTLIYYGELFNFENIKLFKQCGSGTIETEKKKKKCEKLPCFSCKFSACILVHLLMKTPLECPEKFLSNYFKICIIIEAWSETQTHKKNPKMYISNLFFKNFAWIYFRGRKNSKNFAETNFHGFGKNPWNPRRLISRKINLREN